MKDGLIVTALSVLPRKRGARVMGWLARTGLSRLGVRLFVRAYGVDTSTAEHPIQHYPTLEAFFTRRLKPEARPIDPGPTTLVSPCDATVAAVGRTTDGAIEVAPGRVLHLGELLGRSLDGELDTAVLYLSPRDYHRVHVPREGRITAWSYTPGDLWPVFPAAVRKVEGLFARNERMAVQLATSEGPLDVVLVGAFGVGRIELCLSELLANDFQEARAEVADAPVERGSELGVFHLGSTVVLAAPPGAWTWDLRVGQSVRMGQAIGTAEG